VVAALVKWGHSFLGKGSFIYPVRANAETKLVLGLSSLPASQVSEILHYSMRSYGLQDEG
jgi:hypothetical protein